MARGDSVAVETISSSAEDVMRKREKLAEVRELLISGDFIQDEKIEIERSKEFSEISTVVGVARRMIEGMNV